MNEDEESNLLEERDFGKLTNSSLKSIINQIKATYNIVASTTGTKKDLIASVKLAIAKAKESEVGNSVEVDDDEMDSSNTESGNE